MIDDDDLDPDERAELEAQLLDLEDKDEIDDFDETELRYLRRVLHDQ